MISVVRERDVLKAIRLTERQVTKECLDFLRAHGWRCIRLQSGLVRGFGNGGTMRVGERGMPDWLCARPISRFGVFQIFFLEVKGTGKKPSASQLQWIQRAEKDGYCCAVVDSLESLEKWELR